MNSQFQHAMHALNRSLFAFAVALLLAGCASSNAQNATSTPERTEVRGSDAEIEISLANGTAQEKEAREQLMRLLSEYDLDSWIITQEVRIEAGVDPYSTPLRLNTRHLDDDKMQLSIFLHEQAHLLPEDKREAAAQDLREMYPKIPGLPVDINEVPEEQRGAVEEFKQSTYNHIVVAWVELDAMTELTSEEEAREVMSEKIRMLTDEPYTTQEAGFVWYNNRVLEDTQRIGSVLAEHGLIITPEKGLVAENRE